jgi:hypothetical protein
MRFVNLASLLFLVASAVALWTFQLPASAEKVATAFDQPMASTSAK